MGRQKEQQQQQQKSVDLTTSGSKLQQQLINVEEEVQSRFMFRDTAQTRGVGIGGGGGVGGGGRGSYMIDTSSSYSLAESARTKSSTSTDYSPRMSTTNSVITSPRAPPPHPPSNDQHSNSGNNNVSKLLDFSSSSPIKAYYNSNNTEKLGSTPQRSFARTPSPTQLHDNNNSNTAPEVRRNGHRHTESRLKGGEEDTRAESTQQLGNIEHVLQASGGRLDELYKKISESAVKDHDSVFEGLQWDILKEFGYISWYGLACTLGSYLSCRCSKEDENSESEEKGLSTMKVHVDLVLEQLEELKSSLESDSHIYKLVASTLLYCCSVVRHLEQRPKTCSCFGSRANGPLKQQIDNNIHELRSLHDNLSFATLAAVGNRALESMSPVAGAEPAYAKTPRQEQPGAIVGLEQHINHIVNFTKKSGVSLIGIYGQAGLGKTTLLNKIVAQIEKAEKQMFAYVEVNDDLQRLQSSLLLQLGGERKEFSSTSQGRNAILYQLQKLKQQHKVVRVAVDNLFDPRSVGELFPHSMGKVLSTNSCVIITCPSLAIVNKMDQLCRTAVPAYHYLPFKLPHLGSEHAKALFLSHAASRPVNLLSSANGVISRYENLANHFLPLCDGLPLALKLVGLYFSKPVNRNEENWMAVSKHMKLVAGEAETPEDQMFAKLMVIYEKLRPAEREAFQDMAAFFRCWDWRTVQRIIGKSQLDALVDQGLLHAKLMDVESVPGIAQLTRYSEQPLKTEMVMMHDLLYALASKHSQGNRVLSEDQTHLPDRLLMDGPGTELSQIQGLSLISCKEPLQGSMLEKMIGLRVIILHDTLIKGYCTKVLSQLQFFYWGKSLLARDVRVPFQMGRLRKLEMLILRANDIDLAMKLPPQLKDLTVIGCNNMEEMPATVPLLTALQELHLISCNKLQDLTHAFGNLKMLRRFRLENCMSIRQLPKSIGQLTNLQQMDLSGCTNITTLPLEMGCLVALNRLNLTRCKCLIRLPSEIGSLCKLTYLNLGRCGIATLPPEIGKLQQLEDLSLSGCIRLEKLPKEIGQLGRLLQLNLSLCTSLKELPHETGRLSSLQKLSLHSCTSLTRLPVEIYDLVKLQTLDLDYCKLLAHLPSEIGKLRSLEHLSLNCCTRLSRLPVELASLPSLQVVNLVGCTGLKLQSMPKEIQAMAKENTVYTHRDNDLVILEGPENPSFKPYGSRT